MVTFICLQLIKDHLFLILLQLPKKENINEYNDVVRILINILNECNILSKTSYLAPPTIRIVKGNINIQQSKRNFATSKVFSNKTSVV